MELRKHDLLHGIAGMRDELTVLQKDFEKEYSDLTHYEIKRIIVPRGAYRGGGYKVSKLLSLKLSYRTDYKLIFIIYAFIYKIVYCVYVIIGLWRV